MCSIRIDEDQGLMVRGFSTDAMKYIVNDAEVDGTEW